MLPCTLRRVPPPRRACRERVCAHSIPLLALASHSAAAACRRLQPPCQEAVIADVHMCHACRIPPHLCISDPLSDPHRQPRRSRLSPPTATPPAPSLSAREPARPPPSPHCDVSATLFDSFETNLLPPACLLELIQLSARSTCTTETLPSARPPRVPPASSDSPTSAKHTGLEDPPPLPHITEPTVDPVDILLAGDSGMLSSTSSYSGSLSRYGSSEIATPLIAHAASDEHAARFLGCWEYFWEPPGSREPEDVVRSSFEVSTGSPEQEPQPLAPVPSPEASLDAAAVLQPLCVSEAASFLSAPDDALVGGDPCCGSTRPNTPGYAEVRIYTLLPLL